MTGRNRSSPHLSSLVTPRSSPSARRLFSPCRSPARRIAFVFCLIAGWCASDSAAAAAEKNDARPDQRGANVDVPSLAEDADVVRLTVDPATVTLTGPESRFQLLVGGQTHDGRIVDLTRDARYESDAPETVSVSITGVVRGLSDGTGTIQVTAVGREASVRVAVRDSATRRQFHFENDVVPILSKFGCNSAGCHGKAEGQNGFKLSVFGFDPAADRAALLKESRGRRIFPAAPRQSLLLEKVSGTVPHGGGVRIRRGSPEYRTLLGWIEAGTPKGAANAPRVVSIDVTPDERRMSSSGGQQLRVLARYSDGRDVDVTHLARYSSNNDPLATVDEFGYVRAGEIPGDVAVMASYMGAVDVFTALIPREFKANTPAEPPHPDLPTNNFIDRLVDAKLKKLGIVPSGMCSDADFLRRVYLDLIGTLPTAGEARAFLDDDRPDKRARLVEELLQRPEYADFWALKWADLLRVDRQALGHKGAYNYYRWIRRSFAENKPYDQFVRELLTAEGTLAEAPAGHLYEVVKDAGQLSSTLSQVLLGVRIECAQCHHHPFDRWSQSDYYGMQAFFTQVGFKQSPQGPLLGAFGNPVTRHPRTGEEIYAHPLGTENPSSSPEGDRRRLLAAWMTSPQNPWLARNLVNRVWAHMLGRGLIEPVDDVRSTNPPTNPELLEELSRHFVEHDYDVHELIRTIAASRTYQLSTTPNETNEQDSQNYSRALFKRLDAEVLLDAVCQTTGVAEKFDGLPAGYRAIQLWDSQVPHYFLKLFGRPTRATPCECERTVEPSVAQVLHILNSPQIQSKLSHAAGRARELVRRFPSADQESNAALIEELYLTFYSRYPTEDERAATLAYLAENGQHRQRAAEDVAWSLMNTVEFLFNH